MTEPCTVLGSLVLEAAVGYPEKIHGYIRHPVTWLGSAITALETRWNRPEWAAWRRKQMGLAGVLAVAGSAGLVALVLEYLMTQVPFGIVITMIAATAGLAQRSLHDHVVAILAPLETGDLPAARDAVGRIVGRDVRATLLRRFGAASHGHDHSAVVDSLL